MQYESNVGVRSRAGWYSAFDKKNFERAAMTRIGRYQI
jgi:hypothetical protein